MSHSYGGGAPGGGLAGVEVKPEIDVKAMPHILRRIVFLALKVDPFPVAFAMVCSLVAAVAGLTVPRLFGGAVNKVAALLKALSHAGAVHEVGGAAGADSRAFSAITVGGAAAGQDHQRPPTVIAENENLRLLRHRPYAG